MVSGIPSWHWLALFYPVDFGKRCLVRRMTFTDYFACLIWPAHSNLRAASEATRFLAVIASCNYVAFGYILLRCRLQHFFFLRLRVFVLDATTAPFCGAGGYNSCVSGGYCTCVSGVLIIFLLHLLSFQAATTFACAVAATTFTLVSGGYYKVDDAKAEAAMRPSRTFNSIIDAYWQSKLAKL